MSERKRVELYKNVINYGGKPSGAPIGVEVHLEDVDKDGDAELAIYVSGVRVYSIEASTLAGNVKAEFQRVVKRVKKTIKAHKQ